MTFPLYAEEICSICRILAVSQWTARFWLVYGDNCACFCCIFISESITCCLNSKYWSLKSDTDFLNFMRCNLCFNTSKCIGKLKRLMSGEAFLSFQVGCTPSATGNYPNTLTRSSSDVNVFSPDWAVDVPKGICAMSSHCGDSCHSRFTASSMSGL